MMVDLTPERLAELRRVAQAATPDPREVQECPDPKYMALVTIPNWGPEAPELAVCLTDVDARHIAAFDPTTILALLGEIERLRQEREQTLFLLEQAANGIRWWMDAHPESASGADDEWLYEAERILRPHEQQEEDDDDDA